MNLFNDIVDCILIIFLVVLVCNFLRLRQNFNSVSTAKCEDIILIPCRTIGRDMEKPRIHSVYSLTDRIMRDDFQIWSSQDDASLLLCLIDWFLVRANQSLRSKTWRFGSQILKHSSLSR